MRILNRTLMFIVLAYTLQLQAVPGNDATKDLKTKKTNVSFEDLLVQGQYHFSDEAVTTVEEDKVLDALLPVRKDFRDRIKQSASRK